jgi:peptidoglycan/LPS O-acetylase OafA/YrhL
MDTEGKFSCPWLERVSALLDDELPFAEREMVTSHAQSCSTCGPIVSQKDYVNGPARLLTAIQPRSIVTFPQRNTPHLRALLAIVGLAIVIGSIPGFIRGNTDGNSLHDLRHLSIWQVALGMGAVSASISFRLSRMLTVIVATFLVLTALATVYDLLTGHRGPWTDPLHLVEIAAVLAILRLIYPTLNLSRIRRRGISPNQ